MNLLTQEEGANLKIGNKVKLFWFSPRKPKGEEVPNRFFDGRIEYLDEIWEDKIIDSLPRESASDGLIVKLKGGDVMFCVNRMQLM